MPGNPIVGGSIDHAHSGVPPADTSQDIGLTDADNSTTGTGAPSSANATQAGKVCTSCKKRPAIKGKSTCESCTTKRRVWRQKRNTERSKAGICLECPKPPQPGKKYCEGCRKRRRVDSAKWRAKWTGPQPAAQSAAHSAAHLASRLAKRAAKSKAARVATEKRRTERKNKGICIDCGKVPPDRTSAHPSVVRCRGCLDKRNERGRARRENGGVGETRVGIRRLETRTAEEVQARATQPLGVGEFGTCPVCRKPTQPPSPVW